VICLNVSKDGELTTSDSQNGRLEWHSFLNYKKEASP